MLPYFLKKIRWRLLEKINRRDFNLPQSGPIVSFTFDDFPQSALRIGGKILKDYGICGTYYASMGLMGQEYSTGNQFTAEDISNLIDEGHELGCHTYSHISCRTSFKKFYADAIKGMEAVSEIIGKETLQSFSYPQGHVNFQSKQWIGKQFLSCRGIFPGVNKSPVDLNLLRANSLYTWEFDVESINRLFEENVQSNGWLIFYTHDISDTPSEYGCKPGEFEKVVDLAVKKRNNILPVNKVLSDSQN